MELKYIVVCLLRFAVDLLLLLGTTRLCGAMPQWLQILPAALLGAVHSWGCFQPGFSFLSNSLWRCIALAVTGLIAFGCSVDGCKRIAVFGLLTLALEGITVPFGSGSLRVLLGIGAICALFLFGFRGRPTGGACVPVEVEYGQKRIRFTALRDTGNMLKDPVTGKSVLVVDAQIAEALTGLTPSQLKCPVESLAQRKISGLRLIPYRTVGSDTGLLLALRFPLVRIGNWKGSTLVAFAPGTLSTDGKYRALTGGTV